MIGAQYKISGHGKYSIGQIVEEDQTSFILEIIDSTIDHQPTGTKIKFDIFTGKSVEEMMKFHTWTVHKVVKTIDPNGQTCEKCKLYFSCVVPNMPDDTYVCYECRR